VRGVVCSHSTVAEPRKRKKNGEEEGFEESLKVLSHQQRSKWWIKVRKPMRIRLQFRPVRQRSEGNHD
jgi:hypothetical protein